ncbi:MAG TPA: hypothetical protein VGO75_14480, partial [Gemmatimonadaceae bacterium]|nr:hypothetical protein [Gemmatimonadaceae bacterium]
MKKSGFVVAALLIVTVVSPAQGQSIAERLKKALKVTVGKPDSAAKADSATRGASGGAAVAIPESAPTQWPLIPDILGIRIGMSLDEVRRLLSARPLGKYSETKSQLVFPADTTSFVDGMVSYTPGDVQNPSAGSEKIGILFTPPPGPA